ncbi:MAG: hypothetical protein M1826_000077 [Phylliscum demangeonii]|nr:MAG: hypothetical protein M1826_000077 [Phylliscum demangeonii]
MSASPPMRMTRSRTKAADLTKAPGLAVETATPAAPAAKPTKTSTKRKVATDDRESAAPPTKRMKGGSKRAGVAKAAEPTKAPGRARKKATPAAAAKGTKAPTKGLAKTKVKGWSTIKEATIAEANRLMAVATQLVATMIPAPVPVAAETTDPPGRMTRARAAARSTATIPTVTVPVLRKKVRFEDEQVVEEGTTTEKVPARAATKRAAAPEPLEGEEARKRTRGLSAAPIRNPAAKKPSKKAAAKPLSPKKTQVKQPLASAARSKGEKTARQAPSKSPLPASQPPAIKPSEPVVAPVPSDETPVAGTTEEGWPGPSEPDVLPTMGLQSPARRPPPSPVKGALSDFPARVNVGTAYLAQSAARRPFLAAFKGRGDAAPTPLSSLLLRSPARRAAATADKEKAPGTPSPRKAAALFDLSADRADDVASSPRRKLFSSALRAAFAPDATPPSPPTPRFGPYSLDEILATPAANTATGYLLREPAPPETSIPAVADGASPSSDPAADDAVPAPAIDEAVPAPAPADVGVAAVGPDSRVHGTPMTRAPALMVLAAVDDEAAPPSAPVEENYHEPTTPPHAAPSAPPATSIVSPLLHPRSVQGPADASHPARPAMPHADPTTPPPPPPSTIEPGLVSPHLRPRSVQVPAAASPPARPATPPADPTTPPPPPPSTIVPGLVLPHLLPDHVAAAPRSYFDEEMSRIGFEGAVLGLAAVNGAFDGPNVVGMIEGSPSLVSGMMDVDDDVGGDVNATPSLLGDMMDLDAMMMATPSVDPASHDIPIDPALLLVDSRSQPAGAARRAALMMPRISAAPGPTTSMTTTCTPARVFSRSTTLPGPSQGTTITPHQVATPSFSFPAWPPPTAYRTQTTVTRVPLKAAADDHDDDPMIRGSMIGTPSMTPSAGRAVPPTRRSSRSRSRSRSPSRSRSTSTYSSVYRLPTSDDEDSDEDEPAAAGPRPSNATAATSMTMTSPATTTPTTTRTPSVAPAAGTPPPQPLQGAVVYVDVHTAEGADASGLFTDLLVKMGARIVRQWSWNPGPALASGASGASTTPPPTRVGITHVVYKDGGVRTLEKVRLSAGAVACVGVGWVLDCHDHQAWLHEAAYAVNTSLVPRGGQRRRRSMEPRALSLATTTTTTTTTTPAAVPRRAPPASSSSSSMAPPPVPGPAPRTPAPPSRRRPRPRPDPVLYSPDLYAPDQYSPDHTTATTTPYYLHATNLMQRSAGPLINRHHHHHPPPRGRGARTVPQPAGDGDGDGDGDGTAGGVSGGVGGGVGSGVSGPLATVAAAIQRPTTTTVRGAGELAPPNTERVRLALLAAKRRSLMFAPKVGSPLARGDGL